MAQKRKFNSDFFKNDKFITLPIESQLLFFHIIFDMRDTGKVYNAKSICTMLHIPPTYLKRLVDTGFLIERREEDLFYFQVNNWEELLGKNDRNSYGNIKWKQAVLERDNYKCTKCGATEDLHAHHIKAFSVYPELRYEVENGITLCRTCHLKEHKGDWHNVE